MLDISLLRKDLASVIASLEKRKSPQTFLDVERFQSLETERKTLQTRTEEMQAQRNSLSKQIGMLKGKGQDTTEVMAQVGGLGEQLKASADRLEAIQAELSTMLMALPNLPHDSVPVGADETANAEVRRWGTLPSFGFKPRDHVDLGAPLGLDFDLGATLSGSRFSFLRGPVARLHRALMLDARPVWRVNAGQAAALRPSLAEQLTPLPSHLPRVDLLAQQVDIDTGLVGWLLDRGSRGIVVAGTGHGSLSKPLHEALHQAVAAGCVVARASRVAGGPVQRNGQINDDENGFVATGFLPPHKARLVIALGLAAGLDRAAIQDLLLQY
jgi:hypothetical protein